MLRSRIQNSIRSFKQISGGGFDPDAAAFIAAAGITGATQQAAINQFVLNLKGQGSTTNNSNFWSKLQAVYPMIPIDDVTATRDAYKFNLKDPRDLDAAFRITWVNNPTAALSGIQGNGINAYGNTHYLPSANALLNDHFFMFDGNTGVNNMGSSTIANNPYNTTFATSFYGVNSSLANISNSVGNGFNLFQRTSVNAMASYVNSSTATSTSAIGSSFRPAFEYYLLCRNLGGSAAGFSSTTYRMFAFGQSLTEQEIQDFLDARNELNTALGR